ncbi:hypothetical protein B9Z19DRAFT_1088830 [Tuber borchii]|uniref:Uncharacterized protein n=1 Tax=Tuber borchii TaxID=42251 RepID=A0A2T6ZL57_TUBBO|nr:hypothetical protein B9Z19DRAFT_1088830 [Tuber borchii]
MVACYRFQGSWKWEKGLEGIMESLPTKPTLSGRCYLHRCIYHPLCTTILAQYTLLLPKNRTHPSNPRPPNRRDLDSTRWAVTFPSSPSSNANRAQPPRPFQETISVNRRRTISTIDPINQTNPTCHQNTKHEHNLSPLKS